MNRSWLRVILFYDALILGLILLYASIGKLVDLEGFAMLIADYQLLPVALTRPFAAVLAWGEFLCGMGLLYRFHSRVLGMTATALFIVFFAAIALAMVRGLEIDCGCFPLLGAVKTGWAALGRTAALLVLSSLLVISQKNPPHISEEHRQSSRA